MNKALEKVGLKWSMLATTSWEAMFETLVAYVEEKVRVAVLKSSCGRLAWTQQWRCTEQERDKLGR